MPQNVADGRSVDTLAAAIKDPEVDVMTVDTQVLAQDGEKCGSPFFVPHP